MLIGRGNGHRQRPNITGAVVQWNDGLVLDQSYIQTHFIDWINEEINKRLHDCWEEAETKLS